MKKYSRWLASLPGFALWLGAIPAAGQSTPALSERLYEVHQPFPPREIPFYAEVNLLLNPVYVWQFSGRYRLNGHKLDIPKVYAPRFYSTQPWQKAFSDVGEIADQANSAYGSIYLKFLEKSSHPFLHHIRLVIGATHEKLEADSGAVQYSYRDGGTEATIMLEKNVAWRLSTKQYQSNGILFGINAQAGVFGSAAKVRTRIDYNGYHINSVDTGRWQWPSPRNGWGWLAGMNVEVGGLLCHDEFINKSFSTDCWLGRGLFWFFRRMGVTVGTKLMFIGLNSADGVNVSGIPGVTSGRLRMSNYSLFLTGPVINLKWISLK